jgi:hypothetical protein
VTTDPTPPADEVVYCEAHPSVATELRCGRCERPICVRCMVHTPGGIRCPACARLRRPVMYELHLLDYVKAIGVAAALTVALGIAGAILLPPGRGIPLFGLMLAILAGVGGGSVMAAAITRATGGKRGLAMQLTAGGALVAAFLLRLALTGALAFLLGDLMGGIAVVAAIATAWQRLT